MSFLVGFLDFLIVLLTLSFPVLPPVVVFFSFACPFPHKFHLLLASLLRPYPRLRYPFLCGDSYTLWFGIDIGFIRLRRMPILFFILPLRFMVPSLICSYPTTPRPPPAPPRRSSPFDSIVYGGFERLCRFVHVSPCQFRSCVSEPLLCDDFEPETMKFEHVVAVVGYGGLETEGSLCPRFDGG